MILKLIPCKNTLACGVQVGFVQSYVFDNFETVLK